MRLKPLILGALGLSQVKQTTAHTDKSLEACANQIGAKLYQSPPIAYKACTERTLEPICYDENVKPLISDLSKECAKNPSNIQERQQLDSFQFTADVRSGFIQAAGKTKAGFKQTPLKGAKTAQNTNRPRHNPVFRYKGAVASIPPELRRAPNRLREREEL